VGRQKLENIGRSPDLPGCVLLCASGLPARAPSTPPLSPANIFAPASTPTQSIFGLSTFVLAVPGAIFIIVFTLLAYSVVKFRKRKNDDGREATDERSTRGTALWQSRNVQQLVTRRQTDSRPCRRLV
jgi:heme/copper-type cytochrome/quinol oxidase subunit 2